MTIQDTYQFLQSHKRRIANPRAFVGYLRQMDRARLRVWLMSAGFVVAALIVGEFWLSSGRWVSTDNAYLHAPKLMVSTDVSGLVTQVAVKEGEKVKAGQVLFRIDPQQYEIALNAAQAQQDLTKTNLIAAQQDYKRLQIDVAGLEAQVSLAEANNARAAALVEMKAGTNAAYDVARFTLISVKKQLESSRQQLQVALTHLGGDATRPVEQHPQYLAAQAQVDEARRQLDHTIVHAPFAGIVTAVDSLQPGMFLVSQTAALTNTGAIGLISTDDIWIDANVKETDLTYAKIGNPVTIKIDTYPDRVFKGHVVSIAPASGSEFSILPAQNASGNWVKVVQRVPMRIALDADSNMPALRAGMSVLADIDTGRRHSLWGANGQTNE